MLFARSRWPSRSRRHSSGSSFGICATRSNVKRSKSKQFFNNDSARFGSRVFPAITFVSSFSFTLSSSSSSLSINSILDRPITITLSAGRRCCYSTRLREELNSHWAVSQSEPVNQSVVTRLTIINVKLLCHTFELWMFFNGDWKRIANWLIDAMWVVNGHSTMARQWAVTRSRKLFEIYWFLGEFVIRRRGVYNRDDNFGESIRDSNDDRFRRKQFLRNFLAKFFSCCLLLTRKSDGLTPQSKFISKPVNPVVVVVIGENWWNLWIFHENWSFSSRNGSHAIPRPVALPTRLCHRRANAGPNDVISLVAGPSLSKHRETATTLKNDRAFRNAWWFSRKNDQI